MAQKPHIGDGMDQADYIRRGAELEREWAHIRQLEAHRRNLERETWWTPVKLISAVVLPTAAVIGATAVITATLIGYFGK